eukprot:6212982-Pleurochrysis_carterae.AAC.3
MEMAQAGSALALRSMQEARALLASVFAKSGIGRSNPHGWPCAGLLFGCLVRVVLRPGQR